MHILLSDIAKHFGREIVFEGVDLELAPGSRTALLGHNGSGKSTLLQLIAGAIVPTRGSITHSLHGRPIAQEALYRSVSIAAPYMALYDALSMRRCIAFHMGMKPLLPGIDAAQVARTAMLESALDKPVSHFSSGMKQRLMLSLAILSDTPLLLLDEPTSNLDAQGMAWFRHTLQAHLERAEGPRTLIVASNREAEETFACQAKVELARYKRTFAR